MTHSLDDALVWRGRKAVQDMIDMPMGDRSPRFLINRKEAMTILESYRRDVERIVPTALEAAGVAELREKIERLREALVDLRKLAMDDHWGTPKVCWAIIESIDAALTNQGKAQE